MATIADVPVYHQFMQPIVDTLRANGRSMTNAEMDEAAPRYMGLDEAVLSVPHGRSGRTEVEYRMAWARTYLKKIGALTNSARGVWSLTADGAAMTLDDIQAGPRKVQRDYLNQRVAQNLADNDDPSEPDLKVIEAELEADASWRERLLTVLLRMDPIAFERLCRRLLLESGFTRAEVTRASGDGGIDGTGVLRIGLLSFHVIFQCKRWQSAVTSSTVRDFRGAMVGRADKGLIITTGSFTADAKREATRDGAPAIDLVDGEALCDLLKQHQLGVKVEMVEAVTVDEAAFAAF
jgi:restriction system protein